MDFYTGVLYLLLHMYTDTHKENQMSKTVINHKPFNVDILYLALNVYHEARGEDQEGQMAVALVTLNRVKKRNLTLKEVIFQPKQFSWTHQLEDYTPKNMKVFVECLKNSYIAASGVDYTKGATYYHRYDVKPHWRNAYTHVGDFGAHKFYRDDS